MLCEMDSTTACHMRACCINLTHSYSCCRAVGRSSSHLYISSPGFSVQALWSWACMLAFLVTHGSLWIQDPSGMFKQ